MTKALGRHKCFTLPAMRFEVAEENHQIILFSSAILCDLCGDNFFLGFTLMQAAIGQALSRFLELRSGE
jgi:hypothetical protein